MEHINNITLRSPEEDQRRRGRGEEQAAARSPLNYICPLSSKTENPSPKEDRVPMEQNFPSSRQNEEETEKQAEALYHFNDIINSKGDMSSVTYCPSPNCVPSVLTEEDEFLMEQTGPSLNRVASVLILEDEVPVEQNVPSPRQNEQEQAEAFSTLNDIIKNYGEVSSVRYHPSPSPNCIPSVVKEEDEVLMKQTGPSLNHFTSVLIKEDEVPVEQNVPCPRQNEEETKEQAEALSPLNDIISSDGEVSSVMYHPSPNRVPSDLKEVVPVEQNVPSPRQNEEETEEQAEALFPLNDIINSDGEVDSVTYHPSLSPSPNRVPSVLTEDEVLIELNVPSLRQNEEGTEEHAEALSPLKYILKSDGEVSSVTYHPSSNRVSSDLKEEVQIELNVPSQRQNEEETEEQAESLSPLNDIKSGEEVSSVTYRPSPSPNHVPSVPTEEEDVPIEQNVPSPMRNEEKTEKHADALSLNDIIKNYGNMCSVMYHPSPNRVPSVLTEDYEVLMEQIGPNLNRFASVLTEEDEVPVEQNVPSTRQNEEETQEQAKALSPLNDIIKSDGEVGSVTFHTSPSPSPNRIPSVLTEKDEVLMEQNVPSLRQKEETEELAEVLPSLTGIVKSDGEVSSVTYCPSPSPNGIPIVQTAEDEVLIVQIGPSLNRVTSVLAEEHEVLIELNVPSPRQNEEETEESAEALSPLNYIIKSDGEVSSVTYNPSTNCIPSDLNKEEEFPMELNVPSPRQNEEETEEQAESFSPLNDIVKTDGEVGSVTYRNSPSPSPNCVPSVLTEDGVLMEQNVPSPRQKEEETEESAEVLSPLTGIMKSDGEVSSVTYCPSPNGIPIVLTVEDEVLMKQIGPSLNRVTSVLAEEDEVLIELNVPSPRQNEEETKEQAEALSPLNGIIKSDGEMSSVTYHPSPNRIPSDLKEEEFPVEQNVLSPRQKEEETEEKAEALSPINYIIKSDREVSSVTYRPSSSPNRFASVLIEEDEVPVEQNVPSPRQNEDEREEKAEALSPLNYIIKSDGEVSSVMYRPSPIPFPGVLTEEDEVPVELNVPSPRQNEEETKEQAEALFPLTDISIDGEVSSVTYHPSPNRVSSDLKEEEEVQIELNVPSPKQNEEETEEQAEALSPFNDIIKSDREVGSVTYNPSPNRVLSVLTEEDEVLIEQIGPSLNHVTSVLTEKDEFLMELNMLGPRRNEEETEEHAEVLSSLNDIMKIDGNMCSVTYRPSPNHVPSVLTGDDGEVGSVTYSPSPNRVLSVLTEEDEVLMEQIGPSLNCFASVLIEEDEVPVALNVSSPRQNEEETEEQTEALSLNYVIKSDGEVSSVTYHPSPKEDQVPMEQNVPSPKRNEEGTVKQAEALSPLNDIIPKISTEKIQPLVVSFWGRAVSADLTKSMSRNILAEMFLEVIGTIASVILDAFKNMVVEERARESLLLVSEEAVRRAVMPSLCDSFTAVLGFTHQSMNSLFILLSGEVTNHVNSVLCSSRVKGECLVIPKEKLYRPSKGKMKDMVQNARTMLRSFKNNVRLGCGKTSPSDMDTEPVEEEESAPISRNVRLKETLGRYIPRGGLSEQPISCDGAKSNGEVSSVTYRPSPNRIPSVLTEDDEFLMEQIGPSLNHFASVRTEEEDVPVVQNVPYPRQNEEETEEQTEALSPLNYIIKGDGEVRSVIYRPSPKEDQVPVEQNVPSPKRNDEETEKQVEALSPLNDIIPKISTEKIQPLVVSFWGRAVSADRTKSMSRKILAEMFLEVIGTIASVILDAFKNMVLEERARESPLLVSEEAVRRAVVPSLCDSFTAALGFTHQSMNALFTMLSGEMTNHVNSVLCSSQGKGECLAIPNENLYRPSKDKMKDMVQNARTMLRTFKDNVRLGDIYTEPVEEEESAPISRNGGHKETLGRCIPHGSRSEQQKSCDGAKSNGEVSSVTYRPSPKEDQVSMEQNLPSPKRTEEKTEKHTEALSPPNDIIKSDGNMCSVTYRPSPSPNPKHVPSVLTEDDEVLMEQIGSGLNHFASVLTEEDEVPVEQNVPSPKRNEETEKQAEALSPLNDMIPKISREKIQPLVVSFWGRAVNADLTKSMSRNILAEMFLEVIGSIASVILDAFKNMVVEERARESPLLVSEEAVRRAVVPSLCDSFTAVLGFTHQSMNALFILLSGEVTNHVNSVLCSSRMKGKCLVIPKEKLYRPSKDKMKDMVQNARTMLRSFKDNVRQGCGKPSAPNMYMEPVEEEESAPISRNGRQKSCVGAKNNGEVSSVTYRPSPKEDQVPMEQNLPSPRRNEEETEKHTEALSPVNYIIKSDGNLNSVMYHPNPNRVPSVLTEDYEVLMEQIEPNVNRFTSVLTEEDEVPVEQNVPSPRQNEEETEKKAEAVSPLNDIIPKISTEMIQPLMVSFWGQAVSADLTQSKSRKILVEMFLEVISTIASVILDAFRNTVFEGRAQERPLLVSEEAIRQAVVPSLCDSFITALGFTHQSMNALFALLSGEVTNHVNSVLYSSRVKGKRLVVPKENNYRPPKDKMKDMVQNARTMLRSFKDKVRPGMSIEPVEEEESVSISIDRRLRETPGRCIPCGGRSEQQKSCDPAESDGEVSSVPRDTSERLDPLPELWSRDNCSALVCEMVSKIFPKNQNVRPLFKDLLTQLQNNMSDWNVVVKPSKQIYKEVASAVYKDLCKGQTKDYVLHAAYFQKDFTFKVLDIIHWNLIAPVKKRHTLGSFLHSMYSTICRR